MIRKIKNHIKGKVHSRRVKKAQEREFMESLPSAFDHAEIEWTAPDHHAHERGPIWKLVTGALVLSFLVACFFLGEWSFALAVMAFVFAYYVMNKNHPKEIKVGISRIGVKIGGRKYPFSRIKSFWIIYEPPFFRNLYIRVDGDIARDIKIDLFDQDPAIVREFLISKIPELEGQTESITDIFLRFLKI